MSALESFYIFVCAIRLYRVYLGAKVQPSKMCQTITFIIIFAAYSTWYWPVENYWRLHEIARCLLKRDMAGEAGTTCVHICRLDRSSRQKYESLVILNNSKTATPGLTDCFPTLQLYGTCERRRHFDAQRVAHKLCLQLYCLRYIDDQRTFRSSSNIFTTPFRLSGNNKIYFCTGPFRSTNHLFQSISLSLSLSLPSRTCILYIHQHYSHSLDIASVLVENID